MGIPAGFLLLGAFIAALVVVGSKGTQAASNAQQGVNSALGAVKLAAGVITTKGSWFTAPPGSTASGIGGKPAISLSDPAASGGILLGQGIGQASLRGWFLVRDAGGRLHIFQQVDLGPAGWTGRGIDYTQEALSHLAGGDPTDKQSQLIYLGKDQASVVANLPAALQRFGANGDAQHLASTAFSQGWADL